VKPELKFEVKPEVKPEVKSEIKPEVKREVKSEVKPEVKRELIPEVKPELKIEVKPNVKPEIQNDDDVVPELLETKKPQTTTKPELKITTSPLVPLDTDDTRTDTTINDYSYVRAKNITERVGMLDCDCFPVLITILSGIMSLVSLGICGWSIYRMSEGTDWKNAAIVLGCLGGVFLFVTLGLGIWSYRHISNNKKKLLAV